VNIILPAAARKIILAVPVHYADQR
jgi:hypothetical protein